MYNQLFF